MISNKLDIKVFGLGNPLLDLTASVDDEFLEKYKIRKNCSVLASTRHEWLIDKLTNDYQTEFIAGGATQNTMRYCQRVLGFNKPVTAFVGAIGNDFFGKVMETSSKDDGVIARYMVVDGQNTGTCAVMFTDNGNSRSLCTSLGASALFDKKFLLDNFDLVENARVIYTSGHMLPVSAESVMILAKHAYDFGKEFVFNLAPRDCVQNAVHLMPYIDILFANRTESYAFAVTKEYKTRNLKEIAKLISLEAKMSHSYKNAYRIVIITQGKHPVLMAHSDCSEVTEYPVRQLVKKRIKDTNCCGDAFVGGFLAMHVLNKSIDDCIKCAIYCATKCLQNPGCTIPDHMKFKYRKRPVFFNTFSEKLLCCVAKET